MNTESLQKELLEKKLVAILRGVPLEKMPDVAAALADGGIRFLEICFNQESEHPMDDFAKQYQAVSDAVGSEVHIGAGTVLTADQLILVHQLGGELIVSPCTDVSLIQKTKELGMLSIPGAMTPSEIVNAYHAGADLIKLYIVDNPGTVKMLQGPLGHIPMQVTCNVTLDTIPEFLAAGVKAFGTKAMLPDRLLDAMDYEGIRKLACQYCNAVLSTDTFAERRVSI